MHPKHATVHPLTSRTPRRSRRGSTFLAVVATIAVVGILALSYLTSAVATKSQVQQQVRAHRLDNGGETATTLLVNEIWSGYQNVLAGADSTRAAFRAYLDGLGLVDLGPGGRPGPNEGLDVLAMASLPNHGSQLASIAGTNVQSLRAARRDDGNDTTLYVTATMQSREGDGLLRGRNAEVLQEAFLFDDGNWPGLDFALLANNVNCIMCHTKFDNAERFYNTNAGAYGTYDRVRIGVLETMELRPNNGTVVGGTLYVRGTATDKSGKPITDWKKSGLKGMDLSPNGKIVEDSFGDPDVIDLSPATAPLQPFENLYLNYSKDTASMVDGYMPEVFPPVFQDDGGLDPLTGLPDPNAADNRQVDVAEYLARASELSGTLSGGEIFVSPHGDTISNASGLEDATETGNTTSLASSTEANVILTGTIDDPILLNGDVAVRGDVVIQGYVKGKGSIIATGNVYVPTDLKYLDHEVDGDRVFGVSQDGVENAFGLAAGGNILVGDIYRGGWNKGEVNGYTNGAWSFVMDEVAIFNRKEWAKTQPMLPTKKEKFDKPNTWSQVNKDYVPGYLPRYYAFTEGGDVPFHLKGVGYDSDDEVWHGKERPAKWKGAIVGKLSDTNDPLLYDSSGNLKAAIQTLTPTDGWIDDQALRTFVLDRMDERDDEPISVDGVLYSNNSIFGLVYSKSTAKGKMTVNGAILAPDTGLLVGKGLQLNYDSRAHSLLTIPGGGPQVIRRLFRFGSTLAPNGP